MSPLSAVTDCGAALHYSSGELFETSGVAVFLLKVHQPGKNTAVIKMIMIRTEPLTTY